MYALLAVKIGQQFTWIGGAAKALVLFSGAAKGATVAQVIAAAATRAWGLAMMALPWVALAAAVVAVAVLIIKYHQQIWAFVQRVWHDILAVIMGVWHWMQAELAAAGRPSSPGRSAWPSCGSSATGTP